MSNIDFKKVVIPDLGVGAFENFSQMYPILNHVILSKPTWDDSRDGKVKEILNFKTIIDNPYRRLVGGYKRNENVFFLLAEAMWIFAGHSDVKFLCFFNKNMAKFSDNGEVFHAPYGFRLRHWGVRTEDKFVEENMHASQGYDQVADAIKIFEANPNTRQVVLTIWNPDFDLGTKTKDIPCNDMVMLKIRGGKMITTIQNRSNDLHWGLPTNLFQFSFLTELISSCLCVELGTQTHNSQSLHIYDWNDIANVMEHEYASGNNIELYSSGAVERRIDFKFSHSVPGNRLREIDYHLELIIRNLTRVADGGKDEPEEIKALAEFSDYLYKVYHLLKIYLEYKAGIAVCKDEEVIHSERNNALNKINDLVGEDTNWDVAIMAKNFFAAKLPEYNHPFIGKL